MLAVNLAHCCCWKDAEAVDLWQGPRDTAVLPCKHLGLCLSCAVRLRASAAPTCPVCRGSFDNFLTLYVC